MTAVPPLIGRQITWVYTRNLEMSESFYRQLPGLECIRSSETTRIFQTTASAAIGVCTVFADRVVEPAGGMISLVTEDVDACYRVLLERSVPIDEPPRRLEQFGIYSFFLRDPNGYVIEFQQFDH